MRLYLAEGYPIGRGVAETTCGHTVKDRMEGSGRRWSIQGTESMLLLRSIMTSHDWDAYWESHMQQERQRLYGGMFDALGIADAYHESLPEKVVGMYRIEGKGRKNVKKVTLHQQLIAP